VNPFVGLRPFREDERHLFVGRELATAYVETKSSVNTLTLLFARSGVGKSSFLTSRLIPQIREERAVAYLNEWGSKDPATLLDGAVKSLPRSAEDESLHAHIILDQFEDVFKQTAARKPLWEGLAEIVNGMNEDLRILITMREEWLGAWEEAQQYLPDAFNSMVRLAPLTHKELLRAITRPIEIAGGSVSIEPDLPQTLLQDLRRPNAFGLGDAFVEPGLLQLVCHRLWDEAASSNKVISHDLYQKLGGADNIIHDFGWRHLADDQEDRKGFTADQRVLWAGLARHLSAAHGVKAIVTSDLLTKKLHLTDLGIAGSAVATKHSRAVRKYLAKPIERRDSAPQALVDWIGSTLEAAASCGFLKKQQSYTSGGRPLYELSHDSLDDVFRNFSLEFEKWITKRVYLLQAILFSVLCLIPVIAYLIANIGWLETATLLIAFLLGGAIYVGIFYVLAKLFQYLLELLYYPIVRLLARGRVKPKRTVGSQAQAGKKPSA
jgi:hypothetical protein